MSLDLELLPLHLALPVQEAHLEQHVGVAEHALFQGDYQELGLGETLADHETDVLGV